MTQLQTTPDIPLDKRSQLTLRLRGTSIVCFGMYHITVRCKAYYFEFYHHKADSVRYWNRPQPGYRLFQIKLQTHII